MIPKIPFKINYPLNIFHPTKIVDFETERESLFSRNIYYYLFENERNYLGGDKYKIILKVRDAILNYLCHTYPGRDILNLSLFGSSLVLENPGDYDFLAITPGDVCVLDEPLLKVGGETVQTGISIKGIDNYTNGFKKKDESLKSNQLEQVINRTAISLYRRHLPLCGKDFLNNEGEFIRNIFAQISDLVNNSYELFYLKRENSFIPEEKRARKLLTRSYEAISYLAIIDSTPKTQNLRKEIYFTIKGFYDLPRSKEIFDKVNELYQEKIPKSK